MLIAKKNYYYIHNFLLSKYTYISLKKYPNLISLTFSVAFYYKQKYEYIIFLNILFLVFFLEPTVKTLYYCSQPQLPLNVFIISLRGEKTILKFINNFIYISLPFIDSFSAEFKIKLNKNILKLCFFKFPLIYELNLFFSSFDYIHIYLNTYKFQLEFYLKTNRKKSINYNYLQFLKLPVFLK